MINSHDEMCAMMEVKCNDKKKRFLEKIVNETGKWPSWMSGDQIEYVQENGFYMINEGKLPVLRFYHGSGEEIKSRYIKANAMMLGNRLEKPYYAVYMWRKKGNAYPWALYNLIQRTCERLNLGCFSKVRLDLFVYPMKINIEESAYDTILNAVLGKKCYVYGCEASISDLGLGHSSYLDEVTSRKDVKIVTRETIEVTNKFFVDNTVVKTAEWFDLPENKSGIPKYKGLFTRGLSNLLMYGDDKIFKMRKIIRNKLKSGEFKEGEDLAKMVELVQDEIAEEMTVTMEGSIPKKQFCLPIAIKKNQMNDFRVICLNTHVMNTVLQGATFWIPLSTLVGVGLGVPLLAALGSNIAAYTVFAGVSFLDQLFAVDIAAFGEDSNGDLTFINSMEGYDIIAIGDGEVVETDSSVADKCTDKEKVFKKYGNFIVLKHDGFYSVYCHLKKGSLRVKVGDRVRKGQVIAKLGHSGNSSDNQSHLHFELCYTNISHNKNTSIPLWDIPRPLKGFENHKYAPLGFADSLNLWNPFSSQEAFASVYNTQKMEVNRSGAIHWACFLTEPPKKLYKVPSKESIEILSDSYIDEMSDMNMDYVNEASSFKSIALNEDSVNKYKDRYYGLRHVRTDNDHKGVLLIDESKKRVVGFVNINIPKKEIQGIEVSPEYRRMGIGTKLLDKAKKLGAKGLYVRANNTKARALYNKTGWKESGNQMIYMTIDSYIAEASTKPGEAKVKGKLLYRKLDKHIKERFSRSCPTLKNVQTGPGIKGLVIIKLYGFGRTQREYTGEVAGYVTCDTKGNVKNIWINPKAKNFGIQAKLNRFVQKPVIESMEVETMNDSFVNEEDSQNVLMGHQKMHRKLTARHAMQPNGNHKNIVSNESIFKTLDMNPVSEDLNWRKDTQPSDILKKEEVSFPWKQNLTKKDDKERYDDPSSIYNPPRNFDNLADIAGLELQTFDGFRHLDDDIKIIFHSGSDYNCIGYIRCPESGIQLVKKKMAEASARSERFDYYIKDSKGHGGKFELWFNPKKYHSSEC